MIVVSDTSPITTLLQINRVNLLEQLYDEVLIPEAVRIEGVPFIGLMGVLLEAKDAGLILSVRDMIDELQTKTTFRLSETMKTRTLQAASEL